MLTDAQKQAIVVRIATAGSVALSGFAGPALADIQVINPEASKGETLEDLLEVMRIGIQEAERRAMLGLQMTATSFMDGTLNTGVHD